MSVVTHTPKFHSPTLCNTRMSIITYEPSATMSDKVRFFDTYCTLYHVHVIGFQLAIV